MSIIGPHIRKSRVAWLDPHRRAEQMRPATELSPTKPPYRLLWSTGIVAFVLCLIAFVLWGVNGAGTLFDMVVAICT